MNENDLYDESTLLNQPWNPVSYFEEENEATGGNEQSAYSPNKLASLFETNIVAINDDFESRKLNLQEVDANDASGETNTDNLSQFTLDTEDGLQVLDTPYAINQRSILDDFNRLRKWQNSVDKPDKDVFKSNPVSEKDVYIGEPVSNSDTYIKQQSSLEKDDEVEMELSSDQNSDVSSDNKNVLPDESVSDNLNLEQEQNENRDNNVDILLQGLPISDAFSNKELETDNNINDNNHELPEACQFINTTSLIDQDILVIPVATNMETSHDNNLLDVELSMPKEPITLVDIGDSELPSLQFDLQVLPERTDVNNETGISLSELNAIEQNIVEEPSNESATDNKPSKSMPDCTSSQSFVAEAQDIINATTENIISSNDTTDIDALVDLAENLILSTSFQDKNQDENSSLFLTTELTDTPSSNFSNNVDNDTSLNETIETVNATSSPSTSKANNTTDITTDITTNITTDITTDITTNITTEVVDTSDNIEDVSSNNEHVIGFKEETDLVDMASFENDLAVLENEFANELCDRSDSNKQALSSASNSLSNDSNELPKRKNINILKTVELSSETAGVSENSTSKISSENVSVVNDSKCNDVDVSPVHLRNSLKCLTPDDEDEEVLTNTLEEISNEETISHDLCSLPMEASLENSGLNNVQTEIETEQDNNDFTAATDLTEEENTAIRMSNDDISTVSNELENTNNGDNINQMGLESATENTTVNLNSSQDIITNEPIVAEETNDEIVEESNTDVTPAIDTHETNNTETIETSEATDTISEQPRRSTGSVRRVRFSLDAEQENREEARANETSATSEATAITDEMRNLGWYAPKWIPDIDAKSCMKCDMKFTVVKRRHHCRACGKVLCGQCCNMKFHLPYMDYKPARVCQTCCDVMVAVLNIPRIGDSVPPTPYQANNPSSSLPEAPPPYSEINDGGRTERLGSNSSDAPPYTEAPSSGGRYAEQPAQVLPAAQALEHLPTMRPPGFPGSPINDMMNFQLPAYTPSVRQRQSRNRSESEMSAVIMFNSTVTNLPPILRRNNEETRIVNNPDLTTLFNEINDDSAEPISFIVNKNLVVKVKVINMDCCVEKRCWCFVSDGMGASNQEEVVILIKHGSSNLEEVTLTRKVLQQMNAVFEKAKHGNPVAELEEMEFDPNMLCSPKHVGVLFFKATLQCLQKLILPTSPYLFGLYIQPSELPWAKNFPLRLLLRIGAEFKYYPCPLSNILDRPPVYSGVGRTILDLLADFRNFQYTLPRVAGVTINLRERDTIIRLPQHRYDEVLKAVNASEENVLSLAGNFSSTCDGHLVSVEKDGRYKTQTLSIVLKEKRKVTCASFVVISAALKSNPEGIKAKASIVEDGVMVQVTTDVMKEFKAAIKNMKEYSVTAGAPSSEESSQVGIEWCTADVVERPRLLSPIDATSFDNLTNMKIRHSYDYTSNNLTAKIHWVEVYFLPQDNDTVQRLSARELGQMTSSIAKACMSALSPHLMTLIALEMTRIGLRVNLAADFVEYKIGANLTTLPLQLLPNLDDKLVPAIHGVMSNAQERVAVELIFQVVKIV